jgi:hypothetical protein
MKTIVYGAVLFSAAAPPLLAGHGEAPNDWLALDETLESLQTSVPYQGSGVDVGALIRTHYRHTSDFENADGEEFSGFVLDDARLYAGGVYGDFDWRLSFGFVEGPFEEDPDDATAGTGKVPITSGPVEQQLEAELLDAYGRWNLTEAFGVQIGNFNGRDAFSGDVRSDRLLFYQRSFLGEYFHEWDLGAQLDGQFGNEEYPEFEWAVAVFNGDDGAEDDLDLHARADFHLLGNGGTKAEGAQGVSGDSSGSFGVFWTQDGDVGEGVFAQSERGTVYGADYRGAYGVLGLGAEFAKFDDDAAGAAGLGDESAELWSATASLLLGANRDWELAVRYEDLGSEDDQTRLTVGLNWYLMEHDVKWQLNWVDLSADDDDLDGQVIQLGITVGLALFGR